MVESIESSSVVRSTAVWMERRVVELLPGNDAKTNAREYEGVVRAAGGLGGS